MFPAHPYVEKFWKMLSYPNNVVNPRIQLRYQVVSAFFFLSSLEFHSFLIIFFLLQNFVLKLIKTV